MAADQSVERFHVRLALKTAIATVIGSILAIALHLETVMLLPVFIFLVMGLFYSDIPRTALHAVAGAVVCGAVTAVISGLLIHQPLTYLAVMLIWIGAVTLLLDAAPMFAIIGAILSGVMMFDCIFVDIAAAQEIYREFIVLMTLSMAVLIVVDRLLWPNTAKRAFFDRFASFCASMAGRSSGVIEALRTGQEFPKQHDSIVVSNLAELSRLIESDGARLQVRDNPRSTLAEQCRRLILRRSLLLRCVGIGRFDQLNPQTRELMADLFSQILILTGRLSDAVAERKPAPRVSPQIRSRCEVLQHALQSETRGSAQLMALVVVRVLERLFDEFNHIADTYGRALAEHRRDVGRPRKTKLFLVPVHVGRQEVLRGLKIMLILFLLFVGEMFFDLPGSSQVAFFGTLFGVTANIGQQNERDLLAIAGILTIMAYSAIAITVSIMAPHLGVVMAFLFLGAFMFMYVVHASKRYSYFALQAGLALGFSYMSHNGPSWSLSTVSTRFSALLATAAVAMLVHGLLWPSHPRRQLRSAIARVLHSAVERLQAIRRAVSRNESIAQAPSEELSEVAPRLSELLHESRFTSIRRTEDRDMLYRKVLELQGVMGSMAILQYELSHIEDPSVVPRLFEALDDSFEAVTDGLRRSAEGMNCRSADASSPYPETDPADRINAESINSVIGAANELDRGRAMLVAACLDEMKVAAQSLRG